MAELEDFAPIVRPRGIDFGRFEYSAERVAKELKAQKSPALLDIRGSAKDLQKKKAKTKTTSTTTSDASSTTGS
eukprot:CAMPEP_0185608656 /NCGR_PEP_ID=MMETSP0436-20130131/7857_1 /TAXON_ID=626734 ORGANISM="Favella taraikaensis, Strain Fe Narragansett Bay" /NCGR_SAMPLE_ID=MMETSP0436 /ASSEMBLY_ACC=CAM_ASM_000390 /LENGTH=73 /DNA_ID=CAMNT_0028240899 /DNA_START=77 /DNA_END=298 /DNA_ORIENTATION=+